MTPVAAALVAAAGGAPFLLAPPRPCRFGRRAQPLSISGAELGDISALRGRYTPLSTRHFSHNPCASTFLLNSTSAYQTSPRRAPFACRPTKIHTLPVPCPSPSNRPRPSPFVLQPHRCTMAAAFAPLAAVARVTSPAAAVSTFRGAPVAAPRPLQATGVVASVTSPSSPSTSPLVMAQQLAPTKTSEAAATFNKIFASPSAGTETAPAPSKSTFDPTRRYRVYLFNDNMQTKEYVTAVLEAVVPDLDRRQAKAIMEMAHNTGKACVGVWVGEHAECICGGLRGAGLNSDMTPE